ncbi:hypothetical protein TCAL_14338 [Tigriopus californicus]|uniref:Sulfotransferase domain-containing protein n=1 Tax=Tigriopus californicus TaxID=6832 RepID=A0A553NCY8_TIGCA|nr:hypothetical protein TCAL_14338 [Tigriopus californicus]
MWKFVLLKLLLLSAKLLNRLLNRLFDYSLFSGSRLERENASDYKSCVHRCRIRFRAKLGELGPAFMDNFLLTHESYDHPDVLFRDNVTLLTVTGYHALFVQGPEGFNFFGSKESPFSFITHFEFAQHLLIVSFEQFLEISRRDVPKPSANLVFISMTGRCGSTLLTQMFEELPYTLTLSEPDFLTTMIPFQGHPHSSEALVQNMDQALKGAIHLMCKDLKSRRVDNIVIKLRPVTVAITHQITQVCPQVRHVFLYRSPIRTVASYVTMVQSFSPLLYQKLFWPRGFSKMYFCLVPEGSDKQNMLADMHQKSLTHYDHVRCWTELVLAHILPCKEYRAKGWVDIYPITYENLTQEPHETMEKLLTHCHIDPIQASHCARALEKDSQRGTSISQSTLAKSRKVHFSPAELEMMEGLMAAFDFPELEHWEDIFD